MAEAVESVHDQTLADWELILVDDGSTDRSTLIARELAAKDARIRYISHARHENRGRSASRNVGAAHATAPYVAFLDADDVWEPEKLAEQVDVLGSIPDIAMVCGSLLYWYSWDPAATNEDVVLLTGGIADRRLDPPDAALSNYPLAHKAGAGIDLLIRRDVFEAVGGFENRFRGMYDDQALIVKVFLCYPVYVSSRAWIRYRQHDGSCCAQTTWLEHWRLRGEFLDWLQKYVEPLGDSHINAAVRGARREVKYRKLMAPAHAIYNHIRAAVPVELKQRVKRTFAARTTK